MKYALYARVSTREQASEGESLNEQILKMEAYCLYQGINNWDVYREEGYSGKDTKRPEFQRLIADIEKGDIQSVIVKKIDRLSRSIIDFENIYNYMESKGVTLNSLNESFDTSTAIGRAAIRIILVFAQLEREQISERTKDVMEHREVVPSVRTVLGLK
jgi:site-specific DNA recombinase